ncbi:MAG: DoxX family membrane protein [Anaerolineae bacterium]|nr:DoxX family membrane protein [Anaerolineae bacterium]
MKYLRTAWQVKDSALWLALLRILTGYIFIHAGWEKVVEAGFAANLPNTLARFASNNPYPWMKALLEGVAIPNAGLFAVLFSWGELLVGLSLFFGVLSQIGLLGALAMNLTFFFAAGWTSPSTSTANQMMIFAEIIMLLGFAGKVLSVDQVIYDLHPKLLPWWPRRLEEAPAA